MILILSDFIDQSTNDLVDWANFYELDPFVLTDKDGLLVEEVDVSNLKFKIRTANDKLIDSDDIRYFIMVQNQVLMDDLFNN